MTTDVFTLARVETNNTTLTEDKKVDAHTAFWMDPLTSLSVDFKSLIGKNLLGESVLPPRMHPVPADQARPGTSLPPASAYCKNPSPELQKVPVVPTARGIVTSNDKLLYSDLNCVSSFLNLPWISPYTDATMYPFLDMAYKASLLAQSSPFIYQQLAYQSLCQLAESGSPEDRLFYFPQYIPTNVYSQSEPDFRIHAATPAALTSMRTLQGPLAISTSSHQNTSSSAFHFDECHLNNDAKSCLPTSTKMGSTSNSRSACDPVNNSVPASASVVPPVSTTIDSWRTLKRSTASSTEHSGFSPFYIGNSSELDSLKQSSSSRQNVSIPDHCRAERSLSPARTSLNRKVHQIPLDLSAKKMKGSSNGFKSKLDFITQLNYGLQAGDEQCLKEDVFPAAATMLAKSPESPKVMNSSPSTLKTAHLLQNQSLPGTRTVQVGSQSPQRSPKSFHSTKLGRQIVHATKSKEAHTFSGKQKLSKAEGQNNCLNLSKQQQTNVELGSTSRLSQTDSFIPLGLSYSNGYLPYSITDNVSLQHMSIPSKGPDHHHSVLLSHSIGPTHTSTKRNLPHRFDSQGTLSPVSIHRDLKELSNGYLSKTFNGEQNRSQHKPSQTKKPDPEHNGTSSKQVSNQTFQFNMVSDSIVCVDVPFEGVDELSPNHDKGFLASQTAGQQGLQATTSQIHPRYHKCSSPPPSPSKESSMEDSLSPSQDLPNEEPMHCARTSPEQFSKKKQVGAPCGSNSLAGVEHDTDGLDESDDEDQVNQNLSSSISTSKECSHACSSTTKFLDSPAVGCSSHSDVSVCTSKTTTCGDTALQVLAGRVNIKTESCVSINQRQQNPANDDQSIVLKPPACGRNVSNCLGQDNLLEKNSRVSNFSEGQKNTEDIMGVQVGEGKDIGTSTPIQTFSSSMGGQPKCETEEPCVSQSSSLHQEQCTLKENQDDETAAAAAGEAELADGQCCDAGTQPSSIPVTPVYHHANNFVDKDGSSTEDQHEESCKEERQKALPTNDTLVHRNKPSSVMGLNSLDLNKTTNRGHMFSLEPFHQSSISGRWMKRRRTEDNGIKKSFNNDATLEDMNRQNSCMEHNGPFFKKPRLPDDDVKVPMASSLGLPRSPRQIGSPGLWQPSHVTSSSLQEKHQKLSANRRNSSLLPFSSDDDLDKPTGKHPCKTKHTSEAVEVENEEGGDVEDRMVQVSSDTSSPPPQPNLAVEPAPSELRRVVANKQAGETLLQHAARLGDEEAVLTCLQLRLCNVNHRDSAGYCALHEACMRGWLAIVRHLVEHGADVNCSAQDGTRPLHDAIENNHLEVVRFLLACGADPTLTSLSGRGPINITNSVAMETFLEEYLADLQGRPEGDSGICWDFYGSSVCEPSNEGGLYNILADPPGPEEEEEENEEQETAQRVRREEFEFELSDQPLLPCYTLQVSPSVGPRNWLLLCDVLARLRMTPRAFHRLFPHLEVCAIPEADFYCQTSLSQLWTDAAQQASFRPDAKDLLELVEATPEMAAVLGSSLESVDSREPPEPVPSPSSAPSPSSSPTVPVLPEHETTGKALQGRSQCCSSVAATEMKADASKWVTHSQVAPSHTHPKEAVNMLEAKNKDCASPASKTDFGVWEVQHLQNRVPVSINCATKENLQCGEISENTERNHNSRNEDSEGVTEVVREGFKKVSGCTTEQKCQTLRVRNGLTVRMDAAWRRNLANVRVHIRDLGIKFTRGLTSSNVMDYRKVVDKITENKVTQLKNQLGR
ncbi:uncharacterized protein LOC144014430 [Festucalex cinctus]